MNAAPPAVLVEFRVGTLDRHLSNTLVALDTLATDALPDLLAEPDIGFSGLKGSSWNSIGRLPRLN